MLGAVIGDIVGSVYEFNNCRKKNFGPLFHHEASFTDDTVCTIAVADALVRPLEFDCDRIDINFTGPVSMFDGKSERLPPLFSWR